MALLYVDQEFKSYSEFLKVLEEYQDTNNVVFVKASGGTVENANKDLPANDPRRYPECLKYTNIVFTCKFGGRKRTGTGDGTRSMQASFKVGCPGKLQLIASRNGILTVKVFNDQHENHDNSKEIYDALPENRTLDEEGQEKAKLLFKGGCKPSVVRNLLRGNQKGMLTARDLANMRAQWKAEEHGHTPEDERLMDVLGKLIAEDPGAVISITKTEVDNELQFIFLQTSEMRENVAKYGKVILIDHTYKINKNRMPVCVLMVMDGGGSGRAAGYAFVANEKLTTVGAVLQAFRESITEEVAEKVRTIIVDKDPSEIGAIQAVFPNAAIQLCSFHVSKVLNEKTKKETPEVKRVIKQLRSTVKDSEFPDLVNQIKEEATSKFFDYFDTNWLKCPQAWCNRDKIKSLNLGNTTTNRVENHNSKLKMILNSHSTLAESITKILELTRSKDEAVLFRDITENVKEAYLTNDSNPDLKGILKDLTRYAAKMQIWEYKSDTDASEIEYYESKETSCTCLHFWSYEMPCRHMFRCRRQAGSKMHLLEDYDQMFHKKNSLQPSSAPQPARKFVLTSVPALKAKTPREKFIVADQVTKELVSILQLSGNSGNNPQFAQRINVLKDLQKNWAAGNEVEVIPIKDLTSDLTISQKKSTVGLATNSAADDSPTDHQETVVCQPLTLSSDGTVNGTEVGVDINGNVPTQPVSEEILMITTHTDHQQTVSNVTAGVRYLSSFTPEDGEMIFLDVENNDNGPPQSDGEDEIDGGMISSDGENKVNGPPQSHEEDEIDEEMIFLDVENNDNGPPQSDGEDEIDGGMISSDDEYDSSTPLDLDLTDGPSNQNNLPANVPLNDVGIGIQLDNLFPQSRPVNTDGGIHSSGERNCNIATSVSLDLNDEPSKLYSLPVSVPSNNTGIQLSNFVAQFERVNADGIISSNKGKLDTPTSVGLDLNGAPSIRKSLSASGPSYTIGFQPGNLFTQIKPVKNVSGVNMNSSVPSNPSFAGTSTVLDFKAGNSESKNVEYSHLFEDGGDDLLTDLVSLMDPPESFDRGASNSQGNKVSETSQVAQSLPNLESQTNPAGVTTPNCFCGIPAVRRTARNSPNKQFFGCSRYFSTEQKHCGFHRFTKALNSAAPNLKELLHGVKVPTAVKTKGRPHQEHKTCQIRLSQGNASQIGSSDKFLIKKPAGAYTTPFQRRQVAGEQISNNDVTDNGNNSYTIRSQTNGNSMYTVTEDSCDCPDSAQLCKHIYKVRQLLRDQSTISQPLKRQICESNNDASQPAFSGSPPKQSRSGRQLKKKKRYTPSKP